MKDELNETAGELLDWLKVSAENGGDFLAEQAPLYAQEVVAWEFWSNVIGAVLLPIGISAAVLLCRALWRLEKAEEESGSVGNPLFIMGMVGSAVISVALVVPWLFAITGAVKAKIAPRMVIIEHVRGLAGNK